MRLSRKTEYTVISFSQTGTTVCRFSRSRPNKYKVSGYASVKAGNELDHTAAFKTAVKQAGGWRGCMILSGDLPGGEFFRCPALDIPGARAKRAALIFELSNHMFHVPEDPVIQFAEYGEGNNRICNVYAFPAASFQSLAAMLSACHRKADELIHPLLTIRPEDDDVYLPNLEKDYVFSNGQWRGKRQDDEKLSEYWKQQFGQYFIFPDGEDFKAEEYAECLLVMRFIASSVSADMEKCIRILPPKLRMKRLRYHLGAMIALLLLLIGVSNIDNVRGQMTQYNEFQGLMREKKQLAAKIAETKRLLKKKEKQEKDRKRIMQYNPGDKDLLKQLFQLSKIVPDDAMISYFRITNHTISVNIPTSSDNANYQKSIKEIPDWDIKSINTRSANFEGKQVSRTDITISLKESEK